MNSDMTTITLMGRWLEVDYKLTRSWKGGNPPFEKDRKYWEKSNLRNPVRVMIAGERTLSNGTVVYGGYDEGVEYNAKEHFRALMVVSAPRSKPFFVRYDDYVPEGM